MAPTCFAGRVVTASTGAEEAVADVSTRCAACCVAGFAVSRGAVGCFCSSSFFAEAAGLPCCCCFFFFLP
ncbi:hypothetical protein GR268_47870 [Rhizobium leguminosarum]|nr:hypothetical protein [Rhizobium leguminosarum]